MLAWMPNCNTNWLFKKIPRSSAAHLTISRGTLFENHWLTTFGTELTCGFSNGVPKQDTETVTKLFVVVTLFKQLPSQVALRKLRRFYRRCAESLLRDWYFFCRCNYSGWCHDPSGRDSIGLRRGEMQNERVIREIDFL